MELATIARPYAEALFRVAKNEDITQWASLVSKLAVIGANDDIRELAINPKLEKNQIVDVLLSLANTTENAELRNFIEILVENDRVSLLPEIGVQFHELKNANEGTADAEIASAFPLSDAQLQELLKTLEKRFMRKLNVTITEDKSLIGGVVVTIGDEVLDLSVRAKLQKMQETLVS
ncbi:MAG: F0F1 ATP synthase subunit delta [Betaproteobacteria bacterium]|nr:F0F1 ATP synthase subunit delta [Betaproteobacteria bacterium]